MRPEFGQYLALALHELAANATKYGALGVPGGTIAVRWRFEPDGRLAFDWVESGVEVSAADAEAGFGRTLLERVVPRALGARRQGRVRNPGGIQWRIVFTS